MKEKRDPKSEAQYQFEVRKELRRLEAQEDLRRAISLGAPSCVIQMIQRRLLR